MHGFCPKDANLFAVGEEGNIKIFDRRESKIVRIFDGIHSGKIHLRNNDLIRLMSYTC